ncbi:MAG: PepSY domain-containing protein [Paracoccus sp. (in: a-proteobacteria)]
MFARALALTFLLVPAIGNPLHAQGAALPPVESEDGLDAAFARAAVLDGRILPLDRILDILRADFEGEIIEIQLEYEEDELAYEFDLVSPDGRVFEVEIDARTGVIIEVEDEEDD